MEVGYGIQSNYWFFEEILSKSKQYYFGEAWIMYEKDIEVKARELPEYLRRQVLDFMEFLSKKYKAGGVKAKKFRFDWEDGLSDIKDEFTSVDLQRKSLECR